MLTMVKEIRVYQSLPNEQEILQRLPHLFEKVNRNSVDRLKNRIDTGEKIASGLSWNNKWKAALGEAVKQEREFRGLAGI